MNLIAAVTICLVSMTFFVLFTFYMQKQFGLKLAKKMREEGERKESMVVGVPMDNEGSMHDNYMLSFEGDQWGGNVMMGAPRIAGAAVTLGQTDSGEGGGEEKAPEESPKKDVSVKPIDVVKELQRSPTSWSLNNIDDKIKIMKAKKDLIKQGSTGSDLTSLILCLENRKKCLDEYEYEPDKKMTFKAFFEQWDTTNSANIKALTDKYSHLEFHTADIFVPELPDVAAGIMIGYDAAVVALCDKRPRFYVIAKAEDFQKKYAKRDPILLVQSPFGHYYHILGAWDEEMIYLPEL